MNQLAFQTKATEVRLLADRLRWISDRHVISLALAQEACGRLDHIIYFLDELAAMALETKHNPFERADGAAGNSELSPYPMSANRARWEHIQRVYECATATSPRPPGGSTYIAALCNAFWPSGRHGEQDPTETALGS
jgi:hypothetical protein